MNRHPVPVASRHRLVAQSRPLDHDVDLLDHLGPGGFAWLDGPAGFVTSGIAVTAAAPDAVALLDAIGDLRDNETSSAAGVRAVGALPFEGRGRLVIPGRIVGRDADGRTWCTEIAGVHAPAPVRLAQAPGARFVVDAQMQSNEFAVAVERALALIEHGRLEKVVLARSVVVEGDAPFDITEVLRRLHAGQPGCIVYGDGGFVGASPELLVRRRHGAITSRPLAGTAPSVECLRASRKDAHEHELVVRAVVESLARSSADVRAHGPEAVQFADVAHLATTVTARVNDESTSVLDLVAALHPTPAVGGTPRDVAVKTIRQLETSPRGRYAGPCGWVDARGDGEFVVALRCAEIDRTRARLHAGAGIVAGSDATAEWAETQSKLEPMLRALVRP